MSGAIHWSPVSNEHAVETGFESASSLRETLETVFERPFPMTLDRADLDKLVIVSRIKGRDKLSHNPYDSLINLIGTYGAIRLDVTY